MTFMGGDRLTHNGTHRSRPRKCSCLAACQQRLGHVHELLRATFVGGRSLTHIANKEPVMPTSDCGKETLLSEDLASSPSSSLSISLKLRIHVVVWNMGAHQPGGPHIRTTTTCPFRSSPPGMDYGRGGDRHTPFSNSATSFRRQGGDRHNPFSESTKVFLMGGSRWGGGECPPGSG